MNKKIKLTLLCLIMLTKTRLANFDWNELNKSFWRTYAPIGYLATMLVVGALCGEYYNNNSISIEKQIKSVEEDLKHPRLQSSKWQQILKEKKTKLELKLQKEQEAKNQKVDEQKTSSTLPQALDVQPEIKELAEKLKLQSNEQNEQAGSHDFFRESEVSQGQNYNLNYRLNGHNNNLNYNIFVNMGKNIRNAYEKMREHCQKKFNNYSQESKEENFDMTMWY